MNKNKKINNKNKRSPNTLLIMKGDPEIYYRSEKSQNNVRCGQL